MKKLNITVLIFGIVFSGIASQANDQYNAGAGYARQVETQGTNTLKNFKPGEALKNYTDNPNEKKYYGGVTTPSTNLDGQGTQALSNSDVGKAITESILNNPKEVISFEAPFIQSGKEAEEKAESVVDNRGPDCSVQTVSRTEFTSHVCQRDTQVLRTCERPAEVGGYYESRGEDKYVKIMGHEIDWWGSNGNEIYGYFLAPYSGVINSASIYSWAFNLDYGTLVSDVSILGDTISYGIFSSGLKKINVGIKEVVKGQKIDVIVRVNNLYGNMQDKAKEITLAQLRYQGDLFFYIEISGAEKIQFWVPTTSMASECSLSQEAGAVRINTVCSEPGGERWVTYNGQRYLVSASCWRFTDTYRLQETSDGSCSVYAKNPACTVALRGCGFNDEFGTCLRENVTYSCEHKTSGVGMMCGGQLFCKDGSCAQNAAGTNNMFAHAVSQLATVAAAGKDIAALNDVNVKAFTGRGQSCKKAAAGFNDCCKDSGWGADFGLASCSSEEKALGQAKERKLTVDVGEYCSRKVLGVCLEKKRGYCVFDSKLAQIIQQQGRQWQLGIGFGGASSPDCRGITVDELQRIQFDRLDFSNFKEDLEKGTKVPGDNALLDRVKKQIEGQLNKNTGGK